MHNKYNEIRSYNDADVSKVLKRLLKEKMFINLLLQFIPSLTIQQVKEKLTTIKTIFDFQTQILYPVAKSIVNSSSSGLTFDGLENIKYNTPYLFISNHRDIVLDPSFLNYILFDNGYDTSQVAIGNNLLIYSWIKDTVRLSKSFIVKRNNTFSQVMDSSKLLSSYIRHMMIDNRSSVWISQREGRTKDGDDKTQVTVLKMLSLSSEKNIIENLAELEIVPLSISYEYEPCDILKATEIHDKLTKKFYFKTPKDDLRSMLTGILGQKGHIHFSFGKPITERIRKLNSNDNRNEILKQVAAMLDEQIYKNYKLWPVNYIAYDVQNNSKNFIDKYTQSDKEEFLTFIDRKLSKVKSDPNLIENFLMNIYSNPVKNKLTTNSA